MLPERIHNVKVDPKGYNVAHTNLDLPPHNDFASIPPPSVQALHMLANEARVGGQPFLMAGGCWKNLGQMSLRRLMSYVGWECLSENLMRVMRPMPASQLFDQCKGELLFSAIRISYAGDESL